MASKRTNTSYEDRDIVVLGGARTPFGTFNGTLKDISAIDLGAIAAKAALERSGVDANDVDQIVFGNVLQTSKDAIYFARHIGLKVGAPIETPALTVNRLCGSGLQAVVSAAQSLLLGEGSVALVGGGENMTQAPFVIRGARAGLSLGEHKLEDYLWEALIDSYCGLGMAMTAENLAEQYTSRREEVDAYALRSQAGRAPRPAAGRLRRGNRAGHDQGPQGQRDRDRPGRGHPRDLDGGAGQAAIALQERAAW